VTGKYYETTGRRVVAALLVGALLGGIVVVGATAGYLAFQPHGDDGGKPWDMVIIIWAVGICYAFSAILAGLVVVGCPVCWFLHRSGRRLWWYAALAGAALSFIGTIILVLWAAPHGPTTSLAAWSQVVSTSAYASLLGGAVGLTIWRVAYRWRVPSADAATE
jgi:hypothetical protein